MNSSSSQEQPQFFARSKTPESPRPVHIPEPSNIPVLENQTDPIFNLMSTHLDPPFAARNMTAMDHEIAQLTAAQAAANAEATQIIGLEQNRDANATPQTSEEAQSLGDLRGMPSMVQETARTQDQSDTSINIKQFTPSSAQPAAPVDSHEPAISSMTDPPPNLSSSHPSTAENSLPALQLNEPVTVEEPPDIAEHAQEASTEDHAGTEVNYQALLDNIISSKEAEPPAASTTSTSTSQPPESADVSSSSAAPPTSFATPVAGLPPRPPPQEKPAIHPNYALGHDISTYHYPQTHSNTQPSQASALSNSYRPAQFPPQNVIAPALAVPGSNGLPPPPLASFQQPPKPAEQSEPSPSGFTQQQEDAVRMGGKVERGSREDERPWPRDIQQKYDQFLRDEEVYTKEGAWDKFPRDSRLFVGNLPTEIVTKRDIFHIFHRFGRLAQISIKQAYGFVQFMDKEACETALHTEQGGKIKDRNMHLEISKPPKNSRNQASAAGEQLRASHYRRSRSPDRRPNSRGQRNNKDRHGRNPPFSDFRDEPRRRDDYRPARSPSPRGFRGRDNYRGGDRSPGGYRGGRERSRSPYGRGGPRYDRSPSPRRRSIDDDDMLPIPKRHPRDVPDVQVLLFENLDRQFVEYVEKGFRDRGLRVGILVMPNVPLQAVVRRQILEGVLAVVKLGRDALNTGRIPIQIFDRSGGASNVRFEEYAEALSTAAELVVRTKAKTASPPQYSQQPLPQQQLPQQQQQQQPYAALQQYGLPNPQQSLPPQQQQTPQQQTNQPNLASLISTLDGPALQKLLSAMQANPQQQQQVQQMQQAMAPQQQLPQQPLHGQQTQNPDLQALLSQIAKQQPGGAPPHTPVTPQSAQFPAGGYPPPQQGQQPGGGYGGFAGGGVGAGGYQQGAYGQQPQQQYPAGIGGNNGVQAMLDSITRSAGTGGWKP